MNIDLDNLDRLTELMETITARTREDLTNVAYDYDELIERRDLFLRLCTTTRLAYNYLNYAANIYEQSDPLEFLREIEAKMATPTNKGDLARYSDLFFYTGD